jgi:hypothetical protein
MRRRDFITFLGSKFGITVNQTAVTLTVQVKPRFVAETISLSFFCGKYIQLHVFADPL